MINTPNRIGSKDGIRKLQDGNDTMNFSKNYLFVFISTLF